MRHKDYVACRRSHVRYKTIKGNVRKTQGLIIKTIIVFFCTFVLIISSLLYGTYHQKKELKNEKAYILLSPGRTLPPKPKEHWRYIKELEHCYVDIPRISQRSRINDKTFFINLTDFFRTASIS
ncbi:hypothetical protein [Candidatus Hartigia pinicola]